jgi:hypothetical protein
LRQGGLASDSRDVARRVDARVRLVAAEPGLLTAAIKELAATPDDASRLSDLLGRMVQLAVAMIGSVQYASVTAERNGALTTVAMTNELALEADEAQYDEATGPCLDALDSGVPLSVADIATTMQWPKFREAALRIGFRRRCPFHCSPEAVTLLLH